MTKTSRCLLSGCSPGQLLDLQQLTLLQSAEIASKLDLPRHQVLGNLCLQPNEPAVRSNLTMQLCLGLSGTQQPPSRHLPPAHVPRLHLSSCLGATCQTVRQTAAAPSR